MNPRLIRRTAGRPRPVGAAGGTRRRGGFTLIEVLLVLAIIVAIGGVVAVSIFGTQDRADADTAKMQMAGLAQAIKFYRIDMKVLPTKLEDLVVQPGNLPPGRTWRQYLDRAELPLDPWGQPYVYETAQDNRTFNLYSVGPDGSPGTDDDVHYNR